MIIIFQMLFKEDYQIACIASKKLINIKFNDFNSPNYNGKFIFYFWFYGKQVEIVIDDRLPTIDNQLILSKSKTYNEFWCSLYEKAYAKFYGSYNILECGYFDDAVVDCTGGISYNLYSDINTNKDEIFKTLLSINSEKIISGCNFNNSFNTHNCSNDINIERTGIISNHIYSILGTVFLDNLLLIKFRNPWGRDGEWLGDWSDKSHLWLNIQEDTKSKLLIDKNDGEFWMCFEDFISIWRTIYICDLGQENYEKIEIHGKWTSYKNSGGNLGLNSFNNNPQYILKTNGQETQVFISLLQKYKRSYHQYHCVSQNFHIFELNNEIYKKLSYLEILSLKEETHRRISQK